MQRVSGEDMESMSYMKDPIQSPSGLTYCNGIRCVFPVYSDLACHVRVALPCMGKAPDSRVGVLWTVTCQVPGPAHLPLERRGDECNASPKAPESKFGNWFGFDWDRLGSPTALTRLLSKSGRQKIRSFLVIPFLPSP